MIRRPKIERGTEDIRVAILDTGLALPEDCNFIYLDQIQECRSWLGAEEHEDGNPGTGNIDVDGHGTHSTGLLLEVAPNAEIFVARVFEDPKKAHQSMEATQRRVSRVSHNSSDSCSG